MYFQGRVCVCGLVGFLNFRVRVYGVNFFHIPGCPVQGYGMSFKDF